MNVFFVFMKLFIATSLADTSLEGLQTGRYELHKISGKGGSLTEQSYPVVAPGSRKKKRQPSSENEISPKTETKGELKVESAQSPSNPVTKNENAVVSDGPKTNSEAERVVEPSLSEQAQSLAQGNLEQIYDFYRERVHPDDIRNNRVEIEFLPSFIYNESKSSYSFRDYTSSFSAVNLKSNVWFTPLIGISGRYIFSLAADVNSSLANQSRSPARYEFLDLSMNFRKFFGISRKSNSLEFDLLYTDGKMRVPSDDASHAQLSSSGFGVGLKARFPTSASYAWTLGGSFFPRLQHKESAAGAAINSGAPTDNTKISFDLGGEFKFSRESQFVWSLGVSSEKNLFDGPAGLADPVTGQTPNNVSVTSTMTMFNLGYRWGQ